MDIEYLGTRAPTAEEIEHHHIPADSIIYEWKQGEARAWVPIPPWLNKGQVLEGSWPRIQQAFKSASQT
jgi:hypothetical protein